MFSGLFDAETTSLLNLLTACLLLFIVWSVLAPILDGTVSIVRNDARFGNRRYDDGTGGPWDSATAASYDQSNYGTNFDGDAAYNNGAGYYTSSDYSEVSTTGWEYAARGFRDGISGALQTALNR